jgi:FtsH-binding integral membrane protein
VGASVAASATQAPGVMPGQILGGPIWWFAMGIYLLAAGLGLFVLIDSLRPNGRSRFDALREPWWLYAVSEGIFLAFLFGVWIPKVPRIVSAIPVALTPFALVLGVAYLLRVVFPKPAASAEEPAPTADAAENPDDVSVED